MTIYVFLGQHGQTFNCHHVKWLGVGTSLTSHGTSAKVFCDSIGLTQSVNFPTQISPNGKSSLLDLVMSNFPAHVSCLSISLNWLF